MVTLLVFLAQDPSVDEFGVNKPASVAESNQLAVWLLCHTLPEGSCAICLACGGSALQYAQLMHHLFKISVASALCNSVVLPNAWLLQQLVRSALSLDVYTHLPASAYCCLAQAMLSSSGGGSDCMSALKLLVNAAQCKRSGHANAAGAAYWEHDYLNGATNSDNLVRRKDSTFTEILLPAAKAVGRKIAALPTVNGCVPGQLPANCMWCVLNLANVCFMASIDVPQLKSSCLCKDRF